MNLDRWPQAIHLPAPKSSMFPILTSYRNSSLCWSFPFVSRCSCRRKRGHSSAAPCTPWCPCRSNSPGIMALRLASCIWCRQVMPTCWNRESLTWQSGSKEFDCGSDRRTRIAKQNSGPNRTDPKSIELKRSWRAAGLNSCAKNRAFKKLDPHEWLFTLSRALKCGIVWRAYLNDHRAKTQFSVLVY